MLLRTMFLLVLIAALAETVVHGAAALARTSLEQTELSAMRAAFVAAVASAQDAAANRTAPAPFATCYVASGTQCDVAVTATIASSTPSAQVTPSVCPHTNCTIYLQNNSAVAESRVAYHLVMTVRAGNGDVLASRATNVAFRTFAAPPYATLVGSLDGTLDAIANGGTGDDGGNAGAAGTLINVEYVSSGASASPIPGNVWRSQDQHPASVVPAWDR